MYHLTQSPKNPPHRNVLNHRLLDNHNKYRCLAYQQNSHSWKVYRMLFSVTFCKQQIFIRSSLKSLSELEQLKSDPEALRDIVLKLTPVKAFRKAREEIIEANVKTANETLENEPLMKHLQEKNRLLRSEILCTEEELAGKHGRQREVYSVYDSTNEIATFVLIWSWISSVTSPMHCRRAYQMQLGKRRWIPSS